MHIEHVVHKNNGKNDHKKEKNIVAIKMPINAVPDKNEKNTIFA